MNNVNHMTTDALSFPRTRRNHSVQVLTSFKPGVCVPIAAIPMLREDALSASLDIAVEMMETVELLVNPVKLRVTAYVVPHLALARFEGSRDQFDRSYSGQPKVAGGAVVPFIETLAYGTYGANAVYKALGLHAKSTDLVNTSYLESYNTIWNFRAKNRSRNLTPRGRLDTTLAPAFWDHSRFEHVVPDFDQAVIDGQINLNIVSGNLAVKAAGGVSRLDVKNLGWQQSVTPTAIGAGAGMNNSDGTVTTTAAGNVWYGSVAASNNLAAKGKTVGLNQHPDVWSDLTGVYAEMTAGGAAISLSNLELAKKTQAFAKLRERFDGYADDWIIDNMMMNGLEIPDQAMKQPIMLADRIVDFAQAKRYATDAGNLAESAVSGGARATLNIRVPRINVGGVVMVLAEVIPQQLFERQRDPYFTSVNVDAWPEALRDTLDPEKVDVVKNGEIDSDHATPAGTFGYAPMNWRWNAWGPRVGGKFLRPTTNTGTDDARQRIWAVETVNPALSADFYIVSSMHTKPFLDIVSDPFECSIGGNAVIEGNTQFGGVLIESAANYTEVLAEAPQARITK